MHVFETYRLHVLEAVNALIADGTLPEGLKVDAVTMEPPRDASHGDMATNAAMVLAGQAKKKPRDIAEAVAAKLRAAPNVTEVAIAGPGFINIRLSDAAWQAALEEILTEGVAYGASTIGAGVKVNVEYVSANPTGPLHIGHARGAVYGDALATLLQKAGYEVTKEYYINDAGVQIDVLARSALLRYREALGEAIGDIPEGLYPGDYLKDVGAALAVQFGDTLLAAPQEKQLAEAGRVATDMMLALIKRDLADMGIVHDIFTSEKKLKETGRIEAAIATLTEKGHMYRGVLEPPKGVTPEDWEAKEQLLFRSSAFGDDMDRTVQKSDGAYAYFAGDLALTVDKIARGYDVLIYMLGADHGGYVKRLEAIAAALSDKKVSVDVKLCQLVQLTKNGEPVKMSKRAGNFVTVRGRARRSGERYFAFRHAHAQDDAGDGIRPRQGEGTEQGQPRLLRAVRACARQIAAAPCGHGAAGGGERFRTPRAGAARAAYPSGRACARPPAGELAARGRAGGGIARAAPRHLLPRRGRGGVPWAVEHRPAGRAGPIHSERTSRNFPPRD